MQTILRNLTLTALFSMACVCAQQLVIPQVADGGGWKSTLVLTNTTAVAVNGVTLTFLKDIIPGVPGQTGPWSPTFVEGSLPSSIPAGSSIFLHTPGTGALAQGWAQVQATAGVEAYVIYTYTANGRDQDATAPAVSSASRILVPFDNSNGLVTALAVVNPNALPLTIASNFKLSPSPPGTVVQGTQITLPSNGQVAFLLKDQFPGTKGQSGLAEFYSTNPSGANFSIIALRANPTGGFTSLEVYNESGSPII
jgi:hypothetical protein